ncbi:MAG: stage III sporulation protein AG [Firmicutes bacterium]|nr:stage III sporulation protein AG [Bacillota bacterium]
MAQGIMDVIAKLLEGRDEAGGGLKAPQIRKIGWLILVGLVGVLLLIIGFSPRLQSPSGTPGMLRPGATDGAAPVAAGPGTEALDVLGSHESYLERRLEEVLRQVEGAGRVSVKLTFATGRMYEYAENATREESTTKEHDSGGVRRETTEVRTSGEVVTTQERGSGYTVPVVRNVLEPRVQGVLVVSDGARDARVRSALTEAVATVLDIPPHKVAVLPRQR